MAVSEDAVRKALATVVDPERHRDVVSLGMVQGVGIREGNVAFTLETTPDRAPALEGLRRRCEQVVLAVPGVRSVTAVLTAERTQGSSPPGTPPPSGNTMLPGVRAVIAVASGKGGVGKSTVTANLALALARAGMKTGILDADIYGPSQPKLMGIRGRPRADDAGRIQPMEGYGVRVMSIGFLIEEERPMIWRGPMVQGALQQLLRDVDWGELDVLLVDMPPGTGDAQLTISQQVPLRGAVIVSTPQDIALLDARKGLSMFRRVDVPVLGIVENMSYFACPACGTRTEIFDHGGAKATAHAMGVPFLGEIPLHAAVRKTSDVGTPIVVALPESAEAEAFVAVADSLREVIHEESPPEAPEIVFE